MRARPVSFLSVARQLALSVAALAGVLCIIVMVAGFAFGVRPLVFLSGSMSPTIDTGALAIAHTVPAADLSVGDVVSVPTPAGQRVTHRIVQVQHDDGSATLLLKGDANQAIDASPYRVAGADVVLFSVPQVGFVLAWLASPAGLFLLGLYAALLLSVLVRGAAAPAGGRRRRESPRKVAGSAPAGGRHRLVKGPRHRSPIAPVLVLARGLVPSRRSGGRHLQRPEPRGTVRPSVALPLTAATVVAAGWVAGSAEPTLAAFVDPAVVSGTTQTAYTVPAPDGSTCAVLSPGSATTRGVNLTWPAPTQATTYTTAITGVTGGTASVVNSGSNKVLQARYNPSTVANQNKIVTVTATPKLTAATTWAGPMTTWKFRTGANGSTQPVCGDATPAVVAIQAPDGVTRTVAAERTFISGATGCTANIGLCGTIDDASTISSVTYNLKKVRSGITTYFNGTAWGSTNVQVTAQSTVYNNQLTFYEDSTTTTVYPDVTGTGAYTLTVTVTDSWQNVTTTSVTFTLT